MTIQVTDTNTGQALTVTAVEAEMARQDGTPTPATFERHYTDEIKAINTWLAEGITDAYNDAAYALRAWADFDNSRIPVVSDYPVISDELLVLAHQKVAKLVAEIERTKGGAPWTVADLLNARPENMPGNMPADLPPDPALELAPDALDAEQAARDERTERLRRQRVLKGAVDRTPVPPPKPFVPRVPWRIRIKRAVVAVLQRDAEERAL